MDQSSQSFKSTQIGYVKFVQLRIVTLSSAGLVFLISIFVYKHVVYQQNHVNTLSRRPPEQVMGVESQMQHKQLPVRLTIPAINVDTYVEYVGLTPEGAMDVPSNTVDVGWYRLGASPGEMGNAVISGHFDGRKGETGVFNNLGKLQKGDAVYVVNDQGITLTFIVREIRMYDPGYADDVFLARDGGTHLNLVTCDGTWDADKKSYSKRLVVFTDIAS